MKRALIILTAIAMITGCRTIPTTPAQEFHVKNLVIRAMDWRDITAEWNKYGGPYMQRVPAFYIPAGHPMVEYDTIVVPWSFGWDKNGLRMLNQRLIGHEMMHVIRGYFHD